MTALMDNPLKKVTMSIVKSTEGIQDYARSLGVLDDNQSLEIEARLGTFDDRFIPGVSRESFFALVEHFDQFDEVKRDTIHTIDHYPDVRGRDIDENRRVTQVLKNGDIIKTYSVTKKGVRSFDQRTFSVRVSIGIEETQETPLGVPLEFTVTREKKRTVYDFGPYEVHLTEVTTERFRRTTTVFEVEIEFKTVDTIRTINEVIKPILEVARGTRRLWTVDEQKRVFGLINTGLGVPEHSLMSIAFREIPKPRNIKMRDLVSGGVVPRGKQGTSYVASAKADGVNSFLVIAESGIFIAQPPASLNKIISTRIKNKSVVGTVIQGELVPKENILDDTIISEYAFFAFDIILKQSNSLVSKLAYQDRLARLEQVSKILSGDKISRVLYFTVKETFPFSDPRTFFLVNETILTQNHPFKIDGIIDTPNTMYKVTTDEDLEKRRLGRFPEIVKWKPPELLTIDMKIVHRMTREGKEYDLFLAKDIPFRGTAENPFDVRTQLLINDIIEDSQSGDILEMSYDLETGTLTAIRFRRDKIIPNFDYIAADVWRDIHNPITQELMTGGSLDLFEQALSEAKKRLIDIPFVDDRENLSVLILGKDALDVGDESLYSSFNTSVHIISNSEYSRGNITIESDTLHDYKAIVTKVRRRLGKDFKFDLIVMDTSSGYFRMSNKEEVSGVLKVIVNLINRSPDRRGRLLFLDIDSRKLLDKIRGFAEENKEREDPEPFIDGIVLDQLSITRDDGFFRVQIPQFDIDENLRPNNIEGFVRVLRGRSVNLNASAGLQSIEYNFLSPTGKVLMDTLTWFVAS